LWAGNNVSLRFSGVSVKALSTVQAQLLFPLWARQDEIDIFWSPRHHLPLFLPANIHKVVSIHDLVWYRCGETMTWFGRLIERILMPPSITKADKVLALSQFTLSELADVFPLAADKLYKLFGASSLPSIDLAAEVAPGKYFLFVGTIEPRKNLNRLLEAFALLLSNTDQSVTLKIVGGGGWGDVRLEQLVTQYGISESVELLGQIEDDQLVAEYAGALALVMPSLYEGFGLPVIEAMSQGVPAVVSESSAMSEIADIAGVAVDPYNIQSISHGMLTILGALERQALSTAAKNRSANFSWDRSAEKLYRILLDS
jgi:glycosyltransferase involved in cell wall biosynthesis